VPLAGLRVLADDPMLLSWSTVEARTRGTGPVNRLEHRRDPEGQDPRIALLREAAAHGFSPDHTRLVIVTN
jgi:hypothetical protein